MGTVEAGSDNPATLFDVKARHRKIAEILVLLGNFTTQHIEADHLTYRI